MKMFEDNKEFRSSVKDMSLNELIFIKKLGQGQFGHVFLVKGANSGKYYALKAISLHQITQEALERLILQEKEVLEMVNFPFIMKMYRTFKDTDFVYFLLSYVRGMQLYDVIRLMGILSSPRSPLEPRLQVLHRLLDFDCRVPPHTQDCIS
jgi:cGMP-dependent protein kinase